MNRFKTIFAVFFLMVFTVNVIIYYTLFEVSEYHAKSEMASCIASEHKKFCHTQVVRLPLCRLKEAGQDEIWLNGNLYDIVKSEVKSDCVLIYVLCDEKEQDLISKMGAHSEGQSDAILHNNAGKHSSHKHQSKVPVQKYFPTAIISFQYDKNDSVISCEINCFYSTQSLSLNSPPPEQSIS